MSGRGNVSWEIAMEINKLREGDQIEVSNGGVKEVHTVRRVKRVNIETMYQGKPYNVPFVAFVSIVKKADQLERLNEKREEFRTLKPGEPFWYKANNGKDAVLLYFKGFKPGKIVGQSPLDNVQWTISESMYGGKVNVPVHN